MIGALSYALDLTEGQTMGHCARTCLIGMRIAEVVEVVALDGFDSWLSGMGDGWALAA